MLWRGSGCVTNVFQHLGRRLGGGAFGAPFSSWGGRGFSGRRCGGVGGGGGRGEPGCGCGGLWWGGAVPLFLTSFPRSSDSRADGSVAGLKLNKYT